METETESSTSKSPGKGTESEHAATATAMATSSSSKRCCLHGDDGERGRLREENMELKLQLQKSEQSVQELEQSVHEGGGFLAAILLQPNPSWNDIPACWKTDPRVASAAVQKALVSYWHELPPELQNSTEFAKSIQRFPSAILAEQVLSRFVPFRSDRTVWEKILRSAEEWHWNNNDKLHSVMEKYAPPNLRSDADFMKKAINFESGVLRLLDKSLVASFEQNGFFLEIVGRNPWAVKFLSPAVQLRQSKLVNLALERFVQQTEPTTLRTYHRAQSGRSDAEMMANCFSREVWNDRSFLLRWFEHGFPFLKVESTTIFRQIDRQAVWFPAMCGAKGDEEIILLIAKHCEPRFLKQSFRAATNSWPPSRELLLRALEAEPEISLLEFAAGQAWQNDFDLRLAAFSGKMSAVRDEFFRRMRADDLDFITTFRSELPRRLEMHNVVIGTLRHTDLDQGAETSKAHMNAILEFLDAPTIGEQVSKHRRAIRNLVTAQGIPE